MQQPEGLQQELLKMNRESRGWVLDLVNQLAEARAAARFCWTCGCQRMWGVYRQEAIKKWPWLEFDDDEQVRFDGLEHE